MSQLDWDWKTWTRKERTCTKCGKEILAMKLVRIKGEAYCWTCWTEMTKK